MIIPGQFWFQLSKWFQRGSLLRNFPIGSNVKLSPAVAAISHFILEKNLKCVEDHQ